MSDETAGLGEHLRSLLSHVSIDTAGVTDSVMQELVEDLLAESASQVWVSRQLDQTRMRAMEIRDGGVTLPLVPSQEMAAMWIGACRGLLQEAPNYSETIFESENLKNGGVSIDVGLGGSPERYTVTIQRHGPGKLTPHEARMKAQNEYDRLLNSVWSWIGNMPHTVVAGELADLMNENGFEEPENDFPDRM